MDGSADIGSINDELFLVLWRDIDAEGCSVSTRISYFAVERPQKVDTQGLFDCLQLSL